jgi:alpha-N-arabinofuranosidase
MKASLTINRKFEIAPIDDRIYGSFLEHLGRAIYEGIYEPGHPSSNEQGFRTDVLEIIRELQVPVVRYPGGNYVSAFKWEDSVGPRELRPKRMDLAWRSIETNQFGIAEFYEWCKQANTEYMMAINLGSRGIEEARNLLEYCNDTSGAAWGELRKQHGYPEPFNIRMWCLGNELDGPWQVGHKTAYEYGRLANETAKTYRKFDESLELVVCGSSNDKMSTYPAWEAEVLEQSYESVDYISLHKYWNNHGKDTLNYLASHYELDEYINTVRGVLQYVKARKRAKNDVYISFDEWNPWYHVTARDNERMKSWDWPEAPHLFEDPYNLEDALLVGTVINSFIRNADIVKIACMAQLVNVIAPISTEKGGRVWKQTIFYPYALASRFGRGVALQALVDSPTYDCAIREQAAYLDASAVLNEEAREVRIFCVNKHPDQSLPTELVLENLPGLSGVEHLCLTGSDRYQTNPVDRPDQVVPQARAVPTVDQGRSLVSLPPLSFNVLRYQYQD